MSASEPTRRRTPGYQRKRAGLPAWLRLELELCEERILAEGEHPHKYRAADGTVYDLSSFEETGMGLVPSIHRRQ